MRLTRELYPELETYLFYDKKLRDGVKNEIILKSRYSVLCAYFSEHDFNRVNFTKFVRYMREKGYSGSYINVLITMAKHIDKFYNINELQDFTRFPKEDKPVYILTPEEIERMAEVICTICQRSGGNQSKVSSTHLCVVLHRRENFRDSKSAVGRFTTRPGSPFNNESDKNLRVTLLASS
jgi:hypothetical protein